MAAKFFTGLPLDGPDPECVRGAGQAALATVPEGSAPKPSQDHSRTARPRRRGGPVPVTIGMRRPAAPAAIPAKPCDENPLSGMPLPEPAHAATPAHAPAKPCDENPLAGLPAPRPAEEAAVAGVASGVERP
jgi:hypothetical protein